MPAFWICLLVVAFFISPLAAGLSGEQWTGGAAWTYVWQNAALWINQWGISGTLTSVPYPDVWNGSLWTLVYEFMAYIAAGVLLSVAVVRRHALTVIGGLLIFVLVVQIIARGPLDITTNLYLNGLRLGGFFLAGMLIWAAREKLPSTWKLGLPAVTMVVLSVTFDDPIHWSLSALPMAYTMMWLGATLPIRLGAKNDISYGIYIYAFPVQQLLVVMGAPAALGFWGYATVALALTVPLAWLSWKLVEKPAMRFKRLVP